MSVRIMTAAWSIDLPAGDKLVLLALADCANDEGHCWPGVRSLCKKTGKSERSLQAALASLEQAGQITRDQVPGKGCNYTIHPRNNCTPAKSAPPQKSTQTPAEIAGKPSRTISSEAKASSQRAPAKPKTGEAERPADVAEEVWRDAKALRAKQRAPLTPTALAGIAREAVKAGFSVEDALMEMVERGWRGFKADWVKPRQQAQSPPGDGLLAHLTAKRREREEWERRQTN